MATPLPSSTVSQIMFCGPSDTEPYAPVASDIAEEWNRIHSELARRLKIKPFSSTKQLTKANFERVARMAYNDSRDYR